MKTLNHIMITNIKMCEQCLSLFLTIEAVEKLAVAIGDIEFRQELLYDIKLSRTYIIEWMCHVFQGVQQEKAKLYAISQLDPSCGFWLSDWAQKVIPSMFREGQRDYLGKKGMSVHVDVLLTKAVASSELMKSVYFTLEYNIQVLTIEMTGRKPSCIRVQITAVTSAFYFMPVLCVLYSKTLKR